MQEAQDNATGSANNTAGANSTAARCNRPSRCLLHIERRSMNAILPWSNFIVQPSKFCMVIFGANFAGLFVLYQGGVIGPMLNAPMTPPWYKTNNPAEFADLIFETPWYK